MTEIEKLRKRFEEKGVTGASVSWGDEAHNLTPEERAKALNDMLDSADAHQADVVSIPRRDLEEIYEALKSVCRLGQIQMLEYDTLPQREIKLRQTLFSLTDIPALLAGQVLRNFR